MNETIKTAEAVRISPRTGKPVRKYEKKVPAPAVAPAVVEEAPKAKPAPKKPTPKAKAPAKKARPVKVKKSSKKTSKSKKH